MRSGGPGARSSDEPASAPVEGRERASFDHDWRFALGDAPGAERPELDDTSWRALDVPHDWAIEGPFDRRYDPQTGGLNVAGVGWYRKHFRVQAAASKRYVVEFDGAMADAQVFLNGRELGRRPNGYIGFAFDVTSELRPGGADNVLAVRLAPEDGASRWYPGAGLYRHVWLDSTADVHVARWGTFVTTPEVSGAAAVVAVRTEVVNERPRDVDVDVEAAVVDAAGRVVASTKTALHLPGGSTRTADARLEVSSPRRWDVDDPYLYTLRQAVREGERTLDRTTTPFGIRALRFDRATGMRLNDRPLKLRGVCLHHDLGALGTAVNLRAIERRLELMKAMGANAVRTSHNPPAPELLDACDRLGLLVMDEAFDMWRKPKVPNGYAKHFDAWGETDLRDMVRRDRNHPSVALYSIGNEVPEQSDPDGWKIARRLTRICHEEDGSRPVTAAFNDARAAIRNGLAREVDIPGFNYQARHYDELLEQTGDRPVVASETSSCVSSRGVYHLPLASYDKHPSRQLTSYDVVAPPWAYAPDVEFEAQDRHPGLLGEFVWTGFDYLGEPTPYFSGRHGARPDDPDWPARSSYFGIVDLAGFPKDRYFLYQSVWATQPMVHVLPHWNWAGHEGRPIPVMVYTNAEEAELWLNGRSLGRRRRGEPPVALPVGPNVSGEGTFASRYRLLWEAPYEPGVLRAVALSGGRPVAEAQVRTAGRAAKLHVTADRGDLRADGDDLAFVSVRVEDDSGNLCPLADNLVRFSIEGAARLAGVDNGDPATVEPFQASQRHAFGGLCLAIVRPDRGAAGTIRLVATSDGLQSADVVLTAR